MRWLFLMMAGLAAGQAPKTIEPPAVFRTGTQRVEVTIVATRSGDKPVNDLRIEELRLFDNKQEQTIASFEKRGSREPNDSTSVNLGPPPPATRPQPRSSIIVLDALNTAWADQIYGREGVSQMLETLPPGDRIAIFALGDHLRLLHDFSTDYASLRGAVQAYQGEQPFGGAGDAGAAPNPISAQFRDPSQASPPKGGLSQSAAYYQEQRILNTLRALMQISAGMKRYAGQKNVLWVSAAFPLDVKINAGGHPMLESFHQEVEHAMREVTAAGLVLYPIDPRGVLGSFDLGGTSSMKELAEQTGGRAFYGDNGISYLVRAALDDSREGYVLTYKPKAYREDGSFHQIKLKTSRKGVNLRYRTGYIAGSRSVFGKPN